MSKILQKNGVVVILDALGVKGIWSKNEPTSVLKKWESVMEEFEQLNETIYSEQKEMFNSKPQINIFSDTIILTYDGKDVLSLLDLMGRYLMLPFCRALLRGIYFRGVVSIGSFYQSNFSIIGPAIDEAAEWYEKSNWIGISLTPSSSFLVETKNNDDEFWFVKYKVPFKDGSLGETWTLDWPNHLKNIMNMTKDDRSPDCAILEIFSKSTPISPTVLPKYHNTIEFYRKMMNS